MNRARPAFVLAGTAGALLVGCAASQPYAPSAQRDVQSSAARYEVRTGAGDFGLVRVNLQTAGVTAGGTKKAPQNRLTVHMGVVNDSAQAVSLDPQPWAVQLIIGGKKQDVRILPNPVPEAAEIPGHSQKEFVVEFPLPPSVKPGRIAAFEVAWGLKLANQNYSQITGFSRDAATYYAYDPAVGIQTGGGRTRSNINFGVGFGF